MSVFTHNILPLTAPATGEMQWAFSFRPFLCFTEKQLAKTTNPFYRHVLQYLIDTLQSDPELLIPQANMPAADRQELVINLLELSQSVNFSEATPPVWGIGLMHPMQFVSRSSSFLQLLLSTEGCLRPELKTPMAEDEHHRMQYRAVLRHCYNHECATTGREQVLLKVGDAQHAAHYYHLQVNNRFVSVSFMDELPPLQQEWIDFANGLLDLREEELTNRIPLHRFIAEGFLIFTLIDATAEEALASLGNAIANMHTASADATLQEMRQATRALLGNDHCEVGLIPFVKINGEPVNHELFRRTSVVFSHCESFVSTADLYHLFYNRSQGQANKSRPLLYNHATSRRYSFALQKYFGNTIHNLALFPIWHRDELLGIVELVSSEEEAINDTLLQKMEQVLPLYRELMVYQLSRVFNSMNSFILNRYTAVHPAVQWKFNEAAWQQLSAAKAHPGTIEETPDITFPDLRPFFGEVDVRNSSLLRQQALNKDFIAQLAGLSEILQHYGENSKTPYPATAPAQIKDWLQRLATPLHLEDEEDLQAFLARGLEWIKGLPQAEAITAYITGMADDTSAYHAAEAAYEQSLQHINTILQERLTTAEETIQAELPHYFEQFKTDGVEYNIYAGPSIAPWQPFPDDAFTIISRWQLATMIDMAKLAHEAKATIAHPMETTQLIFAHATPITIRFRNGEHRFDADGAYGIRYEVIKKRIDKALILLTGERLTQPGAIAIVYASTAIAALYEQHLAAEIAAGRLLPGIEHLELEPQQGVSGLKAMRVTVQF